MHVPVVGWRFCRAPLQWRDTWFTSNWTISKARRAPPSRPSRRLHAVGPRACDRNTKNPCENADFPAPRHLATESPPCGQKNFTAAGTNTSAWRLGRLGVIRFGYTKGFRVMAGSGRSKDVGPSSVWGPRRSAAELALVSTGRVRRSGFAYPKSSQPGAIPHPTSSIAKFPSAAFLPYKSKIADASWCGHDSATAFVTSYRLSRPGGFHATEQ
jgi:hypothetical protein